MEDLLPGFRFYPTEEELVSFYLLNKLNGTKPEIDRVIPLVDIYNHNPWDLPQIGGGLGSGVPADGEQWFFFIPRQEREYRGGRPNRLTAEGYWKATGSPCDVYSSNNCVVIGRKRSMVFYAGRAPNGTKTDWKMNEYKAIDHQPASASASASASFSASSSAAPNPQLRDEFSLCRIYRRSRSSLWAFDRRPPMRADQAVAHHPHHGGTTGDAAALINYDWNVMNIPDQTTADSSISHNDINVPSQPSSLENDNVNASWESQQLDAWFNM